MHVNFKIWFFGGEYFLTHQVTNSLFDGILTKRGDRARVKTCVWSVSTANEKGKTHTVSSCVSVTDFTLLPMMIYPRTMRVPAWQMEGRKTSIHRLWTARVIGSMPSCSSKLMVWIFSTVHSTSSTSTVNTRWPYSSHKINSRWHVKKMYVCYVCLLIPLVFSSC